MMTSAPQRKNGQTLPEPTEEMRTESSIRQQKEEKRAEKAEKKKVHKTIAIYLYGNIQKMAVNDGFTELGTEKKIQKIVKYLQSEKELKEVSCESAKKMNIFYEILTKITGRCRIICIFQAWKNVRRTVHRCKKAWGWFDFGLQKPILPTEIRAFTLKRRKQKLKSMQFRRPFLVLLVLTLVLSLCAPVFATGTEDALLTLSARTKVADDENQVIVKVNATEAGLVGDGVLAVSYDSSKLSFCRLTTDAAWGVNELSVQVNTNKPGDLVFAFAADQTAAAGTVFTLTFDVVEGGLTDITIGGDGSYVSGAEDYSLEATVTAEAGGHAWSDWTILQEATCFEDGRKSRECTLCGKIDVRVIPANEDNCPSCGFVDLNCENWYHEATDYVIDAGLMNGTGAETFEPYTNISRAQMVCVLYRLAGSPECEVTHSFTDVREGTYYADAVAWGYASGIVNGVSADSFDPYAALTRQQMVCFLYRYAKWAGCDVTTTGDLSVFKDANLVSGYALDAIIWAVENGVINGVSTTELAPKDFCTRVQAAAVVMRLDTQVLN